MFARQIAVMKGQAWNVVETLKTPDHGPLELTRRTRVCVWDDLVDIPVAIPMQRPSAEMRLNADSKARRSVEEEEEMDISAANASTLKTQPDLLGSPDRELPNPNRFDLSRQNSASDLGQLNSPGSPATINGPTLDGRLEIERAQRLHSSQSRPATTRSRTHFSFDGGKRGGSNRQRFSGSNRYGNVFYSDADDLEGDLGYSAAEGMEGSQRKVIVERLETVKSKNPVFTCC